MANYPTTAVSYGQTSNDVKTLQNFLISQGISIPAGATGYFGDQTKTALAQWQQSQGITGAGVGTNWGPQSIAKAGSGASSSQSSAPAQTSYVSSPYIQPAPVSSPVPAQTTNQSFPTQSSTQPPSVALQPGSTDSANVKKLQDYLVSQGYMTQAQINSGYGTYGPQTTAAVAAMQGHMGVNNSSGPGYYGPQTMAALKVTPTNNPVTSSTGGSTSSSSSNSSTISPTTTASSSNTVTYDPNTGQLLAPGQSVVSNSDGMTYTQGQPMPTAPIPGMSSSFQNTTVANLPTAAFSAPTASTQIQQGTPEWDAAVSALDTSYYNVMQQQLTASTESQQQAAQYSWQQLQQQAQQTLGINLSNDAMSAWSTIQGLKNQSSPYFGGRDIEGSGLEQQSIDTYLQQVRATDAQNRTTTKTSNDKNQASYYQNFATPEQVQALVQSNPTLAQQYGLVPSDAVKNALNPQTLKQQYPTMSQDDINNAIASVFDTNGNYRSGLYQKYMTGNNTGIDTGNVGQTTYDQVTGSPIVTNVKPGDGGMLDISAAKSLYQTINAPYVSEQKDAISRMALGSTPKSTTAQTQANPQSSTQFSPIPGSPGSPGPNGQMTQAPTLNTAAPTTQTPTLQSPVPTPGQTTASPTPTINSSPSKIGTGAATSTQNNPLSASSDMYTVKGGDTLSGLYGSNWQSLSGYTGDPTKLQIGTKLPKKGMLGSI